MKASLASCLAVQLTFGVGHMVGTDSADGVMYDDAPMAAETTGGYGHGHFQGGRMRQDVVLAGFMLTAEEWQSFEPSARAQLIDAAS